MSWASVSRIAAVLVALALLATWILLSRSDATRSDHRRGVGRFRREREGPPPPL